MTCITTRSYAFRTAETLRQQGVHPVLARLYAARGLTDARELSSELTTLLQPSGLLHIDAAAAFLADAIGAGKRIVIVADYDCDGATACAVALRGLRLLGAARRLLRRARPRELRLRPDARRSSTWRAQAQRRPTC